MKEGLRNPCISWKQQKLVFHKHAEELWHNRPQSFVCVTIAVVEMIKG